MDSTSSINRRVRPQICAGPVFMSRRLRNGNTLGCLVVLAGVLIILALVLPAGFWWFALAIALICGGIWLLRCR